MGLNEKDKLSNYQAEVIKNHLCKYEEKNITEDLKDTDLNIFKNYRCIANNSLILRIYNLNNEYKTISISTNQIIKVTFVSDGGIKEVIGKLSNISNYPPYARYRVANMNETRDVRLYLDISKDFGSQILEIYLYDIRDIEIIKEYNIEDGFNDEPMPVKPNPYEKDYYLVVEDNETEENKEEKEIIENNEEYKDIAEVLDKLFIPSLTFIDEKPIPKVCELCKSIVQNMDCNCCTNPKEDEVVIHLHAPLGDIRKYFMKLDPENEEYQKDDKFINLNKAVGLFASFYTDEDIEENPDDGTDINKPDDSTETTTGGDNKGDTGSEDDKTNTEGKEPGVSDSTLNNPGENTGEVSGDVTENDKKDPTNTDGNIEEGEI